MKENVVRVGPASVNLQSGRASDASRPHGDPAIAALCPLTRLHRIAAEPVSVQYQLDIGVSEEITAQHRLLAAKALRLKAKLTTSAIERQSICPLPALPTTCVKEPSECPDAPLPHGLTATEIRVMQWLILGRTNAQIGQCLCRSEKTVRNQLTTVYAKPGVVNRAEAAAMFTQVYIFGRSGM